MPYIKPEERQKFTGLRELGQTCQNPGDLNYVFTRIIVGYLDKQFNYQHINDVIGALECCKLEFYRRRVDPYENDKIRINGDCF